MRHNFKGFLVSPYRNGVMVESQSHKRDPSFAIGGRSAPQTASPEEPVNMFDKQVKLLHKIAVIKCSKVFISYQSFFRGYLLYTRKV